MPSGGGTLGVGGSLVVVKAGLSLSSMGHSLGLLAGPEGP